MYTYAGVDHYSLSDMMQEIYDNGECGEPVAITVQRRGEATRTIVVTAPRDEDWDSAIRLGDAIAAALERGAS